MERKSIIAQHKDITDLQKFSAYIEQIKIEHRDLENLAVCVNVKLECSGSREQAAATGSLNEMCILFNAIPFKGKFLTGHLKNAPCTVIFKNGEFFFFNLKNSGTQ